MDLGEYSKPFLVKACKIITCWAISLLWKRNWSSKLILQNSLEEVFKDNGRQKLNRRIWRDDKMSCCVKVVARQIRGSNRNWKWKMFPIKEKPFSSFEPKIFQLIYHLSLTLSTDCKNWTIAHTRTNTHTRTHAHTRTHTHTHTRTQR